MIRKVYFFLVSVED